MQESQPVSPNHSKIISNYFDHQSSFSSSIIIYEYLSVLYHFKPDILGFGLFVGQNKSAEDVTLGFWRTLIGIFHYFLKFYKPDD